MKYKIYFSRKPTTHIASAKTLNDASLAQPGDKIPENVAVEFGELGSWTDLIKRLQSDSRVKIISRNGFTISVILDLGKNGESK